jgi:hypothetical protein
MWRSSTIRFAQDYPMPSKMIHVVRLIAKAGEGAGTN